MLKWTSSHLQKRSWAGGLCPTAKESRVMGKRKFNRELEGQCSLPCAPGGSRDCEPSATTECEKPCEGRLQQLLRHQRSIFAFLTPISCMFEKIWVALRRKSTYWLSWHRAKQIYQYPDRLRFQACLRWHPSFSRHGNDWASSSLLIGLNENLPGQGTGWTVPCPSYLS